MKMNSKVLLCVFTLNVIFHLEGFSNFDESYDKFSFHLEEDSTEVNSQYDPSKNSFFVQIGGSAIFNTSLWSDYTNTSLNFKIGNRFFVKESAKNRRFLIQLTWLRVTNNFDKSNYNVINSLSILGFGLVNHKSFDNNINLEMGIGISPFAELFKFHSNRHDVSYGALFTGEARLGYKRFYMNLESGLSITYGADYGLFGAFLGLNLGVYF